MPVQKYLRKNLITSLIGLVGLLAACWYFAACVLTTIYYEFSGPYQIPLFSFIASLPKLVYPLTNYPVINLAWKYAVVFPAASHELTKAHLIYFATAASIGFFAVMSGDYFRARAKIARFKSEAQDEKLRRGVSGETILNRGSAELRITIDQGKSWHESWWGGLLIAVISGIVLAVILNPFGLN